MLPVQQRAASALLLNLGHMLSDNTSQDLLTGESHFLSFTGQVSSSQCRQREIMRPHYHVLKDCLW